MFRLVKYGDNENGREMGQATFRRMTKTHATESEALQRLMNQAEDSGFKKMTVKDWSSLRGLAKSGLAR